MNFVPAGYVTKTSTFYSIDIIKLTRSSGRVAYPTFIGAHVLSVGISSRSETELIMSLVTTPISHELLENGHHIKT